MRHEYKKRHIMPPLPIKSIKAAHIAPRESEVGQSCGRKVKFSTREEALGVHAGQTAYRCRFCDQWHLATKNNYDFLLERYEALEKEHKNLKNKYDAFKGQVKAKRDETTKREITLLNNSIKELKTKYESLIKNDEPRRTELGRMQDNLGKYCLKLLGHLTDIGQSDCEHDWPDDYISIKDPITETEIGHIQNM